MVLPIEFHIHMYWGILHFRPKDEKNERANFPY
jgi:hypothetical protein